MNEATRLDDWLLYNCGLTVVSESDLEFSRIAWLGKYNTKWHESTPQAVQERLHFLREAGLIELSMAAENGILLSKSGVEKWKAVAEPEFENAYEWRCDDSKLPGCDYRISIAAPTMRRVLEVFCSEWNTSCFEIVAGNSLHIEEDCNFSAVYWHRAKGVRLSFDAALAERSISKVYKYAEVGRAEMRWYRKLE
ncbi:hypothetical protein [Blastopirellula marina]|uniref:Uncharacterized protein n=1 Tax=Blastopirellula marina TaxID=124 RepID=A0A2S8GQI4_9BACT|nr:hypothetical protein [Blastopirellula marina]PQO46698.1 hypothetical protein C5Y93_07640 [Blastopirellula marina]